MTRQPKPEDELISIYLYMSLSVIVGSVPVLIIIVGKKLLWWI